MTTPADLGIAAQVAMANRAETKAMQVLMGMITGMVADAHLHDMEIRLLSTWLAERPATADQWPGCVVAAQVQHVLKDGVITEEERAHLLGVLREMADTDFSVTGSASAEPMRLPIDETQPVRWQDSFVVHTGVFMYGTRAQCELLSTALGARPLDAITRRADVLVIGTRISPYWVNESYGRKIMRAAEMRADGHRIAIVSERYWFAAAQAAGHV